MTGRRRSARRRPRLRALATPRRRRLPFLVASFLIVGILVVGVVSVQALVAQTSFRMDELSQRSAQLHQGYGRLKLQVAELSSPGRIATEARRLGFRLSDGVHTLTVKGPARPRVQGEGTEGEPFFSIKAALGTGSP